MFHNFSPTQNRAVYEIMSKNVVEAANENKDTGAQLHTHSRTHTEKNTDNSSFVNSTQCYIYIQGGSNMTGTICV